MSIQKDFPLYTIFTFNIACHQGNIYYNLYTYVHQANSWSFYLRFVWIRSSNSIMLKIWIVLCYSLRILIEKVVLKRSRSFFTLDALRSYIFIFFFYTFIFNLIVFFFTVNFELHHLLCADILYQIRRDKKSIYLIKKTIGVDLAVQDTFFLKKTLTPLNCELNYFEWFNNPLSPLLQYKFELIIIENKGTRKNQT